FVAVEERGLDPCDLRIKDGDVAVRDLIARRVPLFEFAIKSKLKLFDLTTAEGRVSALKECAPLIMKIRDRALRPEYVRALAGWIGVDIELVREAVGRNTRESSGATRTPVEKSSPTYLLEREVLKSILQFSELSPNWKELAADDFSDEALQTIFASVANNPAALTNLSALIEKSEPIDVNKFKVTNLSSPLHWGQKYEPVSLLYYEHINNTKVSQFGCIPHAKYSYIAASPDGIICDESSELYGRMIEIKNVVSREINSIPKMEYWIQMQLQMEVCNLNECDFLETKFTEYLSEEEYLEDVSSNCYRGFIMQFYDNGEVYYEYPPFTLNAIHSNEYVSWTNGIGNFMIDNIELQLGGEMVDRISGDMMDIWMELTTQIGVKNSLYSMTETDDKSLTFTPVQISINQYTR
ncbi:MAG: hypothetical protein EB127_29015, partial [Alphaproteobacteria bacterium]|nr:hypothetical protein [Alphaproteobacteria bacterium]